MCGALGGHEAGDGINKLSAETLAEVGIDISAETPKPVDPELIRDVDGIERMRLIPDDIEAACAAWLTTLALHRTR